MKELKMKFRHGGLLYTQIDRNDFVAIYSVGGTYSDQTTHYEVCKIYTRNDEHGEREALPTNALFGIDLSRCYPNLELALKYFKELTDRYNLLKGVSKVVTGVKENVIVIPAYQLDEA